MSIPPPYNFTQRDDKYTFQTDNSVIYSVELTDGSFYFFDLPHYITVFELNIKTLNATDSIIRPFDKRIEATIVAILSLFFKDNNNSLIYVCNNLDNRQKARNRKFDTWFNREESVLIEKYDVDVAFQNIQILASILVHVKNIHKEELVRMFYELYK
jgi:hypothetical protein